MGWPIGKKHSKKTKQKMSESLSGKNHPFFGKHHSEKTKQKMIENHIGMKNKKHSEETKQKMAESKMGSKNSMFGEHHTEESKLKISKTHKWKVNSKESRIKMSENYNYDCIRMHGKHHTKETKRKISEANKGKKRSKKTKLRMSESAKAAFTKGTRIVNKANSYGKSGNFWSKKNNKLIFYRSLYELRAFKKLENQSWVKKYKVEPFSILYRSVYDDVRNYFPDILVQYKDKSKKLIEVKPKSKINEINNINKFKAAKRFCKINNMSFEIWTEDFINKVGFREPIML